MPTFFSLVYGVSWYSNSHFPMKLTSPAPSVPFSSSKVIMPERFGWIVAVALIVGVAIGAVGTWLLAEQIDQLTTSVSKSYSQK